LTDGNHVGYWNKQNPVSAARGPLPPHPCVSLSDGASERSRAPVDGRDNRGTRREWDSADGGRAQQIVDFEIGRLFTAQATGDRTGLLSAQGATGGPGPLLSACRFSSAFNSSVHFLLPQFEPAGRAHMPVTVVATGSSSPTSSTSLTHGGMPYKDPRGGGRARQVLFKSRPSASGVVPAINDDVAAGGRFCGCTALTGTCGTCHDTPKIVGNHSSPRL